MPIVTQTVTIQLTVADMLQAITDYLNKSDIAGDMNNPNSITINESGLFVTSDLTQMVVASTDIAATIVLPAG